MLVNCNVTFVGTVDGEVVEVKVTTDVCVRVENCECLKSELLSRTGWCLTSESASRTA